MEPITDIVGRAVPLDRSDVDTDQIIPSDWLKRVERTGFGEGLFSEWREDPSFVLNQQQFEGAQILIAGENFGTGSSREHAVWALTDFGFKAVISPRFGDIFRNNCTKAGLLPVQVDPDIVSALLVLIPQHPETELRISVPNRSLNVPSANISTTFPLDDFTQFRLVNGLDDTGITLQYAHDIQEYENHRAPWLPVTRPVTRSN